MVITILLTECIHIDNLHICWGYKISLYPYSFCSVIIYERDIKNNGFVWLGNRQRPSIYVWCSYTVIPIRYNIKSGWRYDIVHFVYTIAVVSKWVVCSEEEKKKHFRNTIIILRYNIRTRDPYKLLLLLLRVMSGLYII